LASFFSKEKIWLYYISVDKKLLQKRKFTVVIILFADAKDLQGAALHPLKKL